MTADLASWLLSDEGPIAADEKVARALRGSTQIMGRVPDFYGAGGPAAEAFWRHFDPIRVLAECAAKRAIVERHRQHTRTDVFTTAVPADHPGYRREERHHHCATLLDLAQPYAGRSGWREEWAVRLDSD